MAIISFLATEVFLAVDHGGDEDVMQIKYHADAADADADTIYAELLIIIRCLPTCLLCLHGAVDDDYGDGIRLILLNQQC